MKQPKFQWDPSKDKVNFKKHRVHFDEASTVFYDENAIEYFDPDHSEDEDRFLLLGISAKLRVLIVCYCYRVNSQIIRIITARKANKKEESNYYRSMT